MADKNIEQFHSCFVVDVKVDKDKNRVTIQDSSRMRYYYLFDTKEKADEFKQWMKKVFLVGKAQTLTVFSYHETGEAPDIDVMIDKFIGNFKDKRVISESEPPAV